MEITDEMALLLDQSSGVIGLIESLEISHPKWSQVYRFVVNSNESMTLRDEYGESHTYDYSPISVTRSADADTLEQEITLFFADVGNVVPWLIDAFINDDRITLPIVTYRAYITENYANPIFVARDLEIESVSRDWQGTRCDAKAPSLNESGNGDVYNASSDPSLIGFY